MQTGELTEAVRKRSVYRPLHLNTAGENIPHDVWDIPRVRLSELIISTTGPLPGYKDMPWRQVTAAANSLAAKYADGCLLCLQGSFPKSMEEAVLQEHMKRFEVEAEANKMQFCEANLQVSSQVTEPQYFVTAIGVPAEPLSDTVKNTKMPEKSEQARLKECSERENAESSLVLRPGQELVVARPIALAGTAALTRMYEEKLRGHFPHWLIDRARGFDRWMSVTEAARAVYHFGACPMYCLAQGGIFNALWEMADAAGVGLEVDLRKIPVRQETIEICEYFDVNPYYLYSAGTLLIGTGQAEALLAVLRDADIPAVVIGRTTDKNDRIIQNGENHRFLDRPKQDELWRLSGMEA